MKKIFRYTLLLLLGLCSMGCEKFGDINVDPTRSADLDPASQLLYAQVFFSGDLGIQERTNYFMLIPMMQQFAGAFNMADNGAIYRKTLSFMTRSFEFSYPNDILNIVDAVERTNGVASKTNLNAMARIMKVYTFARLTDLYGDIPYSEAGKGYTAGIYRPKYDAQKDIYYDFFKELSEASAQLDPAKDRVPNEYFYKGNIPAWKKFANSLRLRLAMRLCKRDPEKAKAEIQAAYLAGVFTSNADICKTTHENVVNSYAPEFRANGISAAWNSKNEMGRVVNTFYNALNNDPRQTYLIRCYREFNPVAPTRFLEREDITAQIRAKGPLVPGLPGRTNSDDPIPVTTITLANGTSYTTRSIDMKPQLNHNLLRNDAPFLHITYSEVELLLADATQRFGLNLGGTAQEHYHRGVEAAMQHLSLYPAGPVLSATEISNWRAANPLMAGRELEQINVQLYITLLLNGNETYANWRRSGFPALVPSPTSGSTSQTIPRRFEYPLVEKQQNTENVNAAIAALGGDDWTKRVWWDL